MTACGQQLLAKNCVESTWLCRVNAQSFAGYNKPPGLLMRQIANGFRFVLTALKTLEVLETLRAPRVQARLLRSLKQLCSKLPGF